MQGPKAPAAPRLRHTAPASPTASPHRFERRTSPFERAIARVLVVAMIGLTPGSALAGGEFTDANNAVLDTAGTIDNTVAGETTIRSEVDQGLARWTTGLDQPADNTLNIIQPGADSTFTNQVGGNFSAHLDGTLISNGNVVIASPFGVFLGSEAVVDVGSLVAIGGSISTTDLSNSPDLDLTGRVENLGTITADRNVLFYGSDVVNRGNIAAGTGEILMLAGDSVYFQDASVDSIVSRLLEPTDFVVVTGSGSVRNYGQLSSQDATLVGSKVANYGEIEISDGSLMMLGADAVYVREFDNPVLVRLPHAAPNEETNAEDPQYAVENHGQIRAGQGHVRLAASDPLGWGIRQGTGQSTNGDSASIKAQTVEIAGGDQGLVSLSGEIDASAPGTEDRGGEIEITGDVIVLADAKIDASGGAGGGTIHIGGEQQGRGELQRASVLLMDEESEVRADATTDGDGGRVILFSENLTAIAGELSARGGAEGGDGGFIETSGLSLFDITRTPDASAPKGLAGEWLIDPYTINIVADAASSDCASGGTCINRAIEAVLAPNFDGAAFDDIFRTVAPALGITNPNDLSVDLLVRALAVGTNVTLSTETFNPEAQTDPDPEELVGGASTNGDINLETAITIADDGTLQGTFATLTLRAAGNINIRPGADISVLSASPGETPDFALSLVFRANDQFQRDPTRAFGLDQLVGNVQIDADITTGGGAFTASGIAVNLASGSTIETGGGAVFVTSGSVGINDLPDTFVRRSSDPEEVDPTDLAGSPSSFNPGITIAGNIDTSTPDDGAGDGGTITLAANGISVATAKGGNDDLQIDPGELSLTGDLTSDGGNISLSAGFNTNGGDRAAGNIDINGATISSGGGSINVTAQRIDQAGDNGNFDIEFIDASRGEGGRISISNGSDVTTEGGTLVVGSLNTQTISIDGNLDTTGGAPTSETDSEDGILLVIADDFAGIAPTDNRFGRSSITIGANENTTLRSAAIFIEARDVTTGSDASPNDVNLIASGDTSTLLDPADFGRGAIDPTTQAAVTSIIDPNQILISGGRGLTLNRNTEITAQEIRLTAAANPSQLNLAETNGVGIDIDAENTTTTLTRLTFGGLGGASAAGGVRLNGDEIAIAIGDGITASTDLQFETLDEGGIPTDFGFQRGSRGNYDGLQMRNAAGLERPETVSIRQDGDLIIGDGGAAPDSELFFGQRSGTGATNGAFGNARIGSEGLRISVESSDGVLEIQSGAGLSDDTAASGETNGRSWATLNGGLLLPDDASQTLPSGESIVFNGTFAGGDAFNIEGLTVSSPRNLTITTEIADAIAQVSELEFQAGRLMGADEPGQDGMLTVEAGVTLQANDRLSLHAGANGFDDLVFETGAPIELQANEIALRAGGGAESENTSTSNRSEIQGIENVEIRDASGQSFQSRGTTALSFNFRQDAGIDSDVDLPSFDQFGIVAPGAISFDAAGAVTPVAYGLRSDFGSVDLTGDVLGGARFQDAALSLIGLQSGTAAILVDEGFDFVGPSVELGGVSNFTFTQVLKDAFNPDSQPRERVTLRAGLNSNGTLRFDSSVVVRAPRIELIASGGVDATTTANISVSGAEFDLSEGADGERVFVFQERGNLQAGDLPDAEDFVSGALPNILALRSDNGLLDLDNLEITSLPLDLSQPGRLILEANTINLDQTDGGNLELTKSDPLVSGPDPLLNIRLRIRANTLRLRATTSSSTDRGRVLAGNHAGDLAEGASSLIGDDAFFDGEGILIEAFDSTAEIATTSNLSVLSEDPNNAALFNLDTGRGPTRLEIAQDGAVDPSELPRRRAVSGEYERSLTDEQDGDAIATTYLIVSQSESITVDPETVGGSNLSLGTTQITNPFEQDITFNGGVAYDFANLVARTNGSIFVKGGSTLNSMRTISLTAAELFDQPTTAIDASNPMGRIEFESGNGNIDLVADEIRLTAAPIVTLTNPDGTEGARDGERDTIDDAFLATIDFSGLTSINSNAVTSTSIFSATQAADFTMGVNGGEVVAALAGGNEWNNISLASTQGNLTVRGLDDLATATRSLTLGRIATDASLTVVVENAGELEPFSVASGFEDEVRLESNEVNFRVDPGLASGELILDSANLRLVSTTFLTGGETADQLGRLRSDPDVLERPFVGIEQPGDFANTRLPRRDRYFRLRTPFELFSGPGTEVVRDALAEVDLQLTTTGTQFVLGDSVREGASDSNLIVRAPSGADIAIDLTGYTPGFDTYVFDAPDVDETDFAALQLGSLDIGTGDAGTTLNITANPFLGATDDLSIATLGDQIFGGAISLDETLITSGRDIRFEGDVFNVAATRAGLVVQSTGQVTFEGDIGNNTQSAASTDPLSELLVLFDSDTATGTPAVQFGARLDTDDDGIFETPVDSDQQILVEGEIAFLTADLNEPDDTTDPNDLNFVANLRAALGGATNLQELNVVLGSAADFPDRNDLVDGVDTFSIGRVNNAAFATLGKALGDLSVDTFDSGHFVMGGGERVAVGGDFSVDVGSEVATLGDAAALTIGVNAGEIGLVRRNAGVTTDITGGTNQDRGSSILANTIDFGGANLDLIGLGKAPRFGVPNPSDPNLPEFLGDFAVFANLPSGGQLDASSFSFVGATSGRADQIASPVPRGASRSDLTGAFAPTVVRQPGQPLRESPVLENPDRLRELDVDSLETPSGVLIGRLSGVAIIDDVSGSEDGEVFVTETRLDAQDAEAAIALHEELFGQSGERAGEVRSILQGALDDYLETTRARRVIGFELRRFVKNRPSTLLKAYSTLDALDALFRYHRRLGLSPGEFRRIQRNWLTDIQPDGISLDELSEAIHPSRYVRGSDILDIFGR